MRAAGGSPAQQASTVGHRDLIDACVEFDAVFLYAVCGNMYSPPLCAKSLVTAEQYGKVAAAVAAEPYVAPHAFAPTFQLQRAPSPSPSPSLVTAISVLSGGD